MKSINTYYTSKEDLELFIADEKIQNSPSLLIQVFSAFNDQTFISVLLSELTHYLPDAVIIGSTTDGGIMDGKVSSGKVVLSFTQFEKTVLKAAAVKHKANGYCSGQYLAKELIEEDTRLLIAFADGVYTNGDDFFKGIISVNDQTIIAGGLAGDNNSFTKTFVFTKDHIFSNGAVAVALNSKHLHVHTDHSFNWHSIGNELTITKAEGNRIYTIDDKSAVDTYAHYLGEDLAKGLPSIGIEFPLIVNRNGLNIARAIMLKKDDGSLIASGSIYSGEKVRIGFGNIKENIRASQKIIEQTSVKPSEVIFVYSSAARKYFMGEEIELEISPLQYISPTSGFFTHGEFFTSDKQEFLNQTMTLVSLSEKDEVLSKTIPKTKLKKRDINSASINALTHLINIATEEMKEQTESLKKSNQLNKQLKERMELALIGSKTSVLDWDFTDNSFYIAPSWKEMLGYTNEDLRNLPSTWKKLVHPDDRMVILAQLKDHKINKIKYFENNHRLRHKDGHWIWILGRAQILYDENDNPIRMIGTHTDITEEKEWQLKYAHQVQIIEQIHDSVTTTDLEGKIVSWNSGSEKLFGYMAHEVIGKSIAILYRPEDIPTLKGYIVQLMEHGVYSADVYLVKKSKELISITFSLSLLKDASGNPIGIIGINKDNTQRKKAEDELYEQKNILRFQAHHDALTGLPNRILFTDRLKQGIKKAKRQKVGLALFFIDLDKFKHINDSLGHSIGDKVLKLIAKRLEATIRGEDTLARLSGDEFTVIMEEVKQAEDASLLAEKILKVLAAPMHIDEHTLYVSGSIGISLYPKDATDEELLLKYADTAMYKAKEEGRNNVKFYSSEMTELALKRIVLKTSLREAIDKEEFIIHYQPQINICGNVLVGLEALVRWQHPTKGLLSPDQFITLAEDTGMIVEIDRWVMHAAMRQVHSWYEEGLMPGVLALNLSIKQLEGNNYLQEVKDSLKRYDFKSEWLELEITEGQMMKKPDDVIAKLEEINDLGIGISIDDFGTGYSSLSLLKRLPINRLKIDRSFIRDIPDDEEDVAIVKAIIALAESLKLNLIAEGVETSEQKDFLIENGCMNIQGHYYSQPVPAEEMRALLLKNSW
jgi:diguanylate cyclase (GGDEF)-like protein/PAS domain S-box-containing protein